MKFERLKSNKIKVTICAEDLSRWGVTADEVAKNSPEAREMFLSMLKQAEAETGFSCNNSRLVIEAAMNNEEKDITLFVTKVDSDEEKELFDKISSVRKADIIRQKRAVISQKRKSSMLELDTFESVVSLCYALVNYFGGNLYSYKDKYYMTVDGYRLSAASEFGKIVSSRAQIIIEEHGTPIVQSNAFPVIRSKFHE